MLPLARWFAPAALAVALSVGTFTPAPAQASDDLVRVLVDIADVVTRNGHSYYRYGNYGYNDRLIVSRDRYGRPVYYRSIPRDQYRYGPPYGNAYGYHRNQQSRYQRTRCDSNGRCRVEYYDPRYDRDRHDDRYGRYDRYDRYDHDRHDDRYGRNDRNRWWDGRRWRDDD